MRHAEAEKTGGHILTDAQRPLTAYGRLQANAIATELKRRNVLPFIVASPYLRTLQTAEVLSDLLGTGPVHSEPLLASSGHAPPLPELLHLYVRAQGLLLIGHQPDLGMLAEQLLGFEFGFSTATMIAFKLQSPKVWKFLWTLMPENDLFHTRNQYGR